MPKIVDAEARREEIIAAALKILSEGGFVSLTLSRLAKELGGSMRLVTRYFRDRRELISALIKEGLRDVRDLESELVSVADPQLRLYRTLEWFLPLDEQLLLQEKVRIALLAHKDVEAVIQDFFTSMDSIMREPLRAVALPLVRPEEVEDFVDVLRAWTSGVALAAVERPDVWTPERQISALKSFLMHLSFDS